MHSSTPTQTGLSALVATRLNARATGRCALALSPAVVGEAFVDALRAEAEHWHGVHVFLADTRFEHDGASPAQTRRLLGRLPLPGKNLHLAVADEGDATRAAAAYEQELRSFFRLAAAEVPCFDAIAVRYEASGILGGLAAHGAATSEVSRLVIADFARGARRFVTLTPPVLHAASNLFVMRSEARDTKPAIEVHGPLLRAANVTLLPLQQDCA